MTPEILAPGAHGGDGARLAVALGIPLDAILDLSASLNPAAPDVAALVRHHASAIRQYPDPTHARAALADAIDVDPDELLLTNGGAEAIALVATEFPIASIEAPEFSLYARHLARLDPHAPRWSSNPNNPTGQLATPDELAAVWDEAFYPLATGQWTRGDTDTIVIGSLTKLFGCPGLRAGYVLSPNPTVTRRLAARQAEWAVNSLVCALLPSLLAAADLPKWAATIAAGRARLDAALRHSGLHPEPSDANFLLIRHAPGLRDHLARQGVLVRDTTSFGIADGVRVAVPDDAGLQRLALALEGWTPRTPTS
jgi:histidinol-phosphate/aromatic aminotransferase/cobyric acid decarboxylase-like protein